MSQANTAQSHMGQVHRGQGASKASSPAWVLLEAQVQGSSELDLLWTACPHLPNTGAPVSGPRQRHARVFHPSALSKLSHSKVPSLAHARISAVPTGLSLLGVQ